MRSSSLKKEFLKFLGFFFILYLIVFVFLNFTGWSLKPKKLEPSENFVVEEKKKCLFVEKEDSILIPKIGIEAPIVFPKNEDYKEALKRGVVHYPQSDLPGKGKAILLGHSAPPGWPKIRYDWVFSDLKELEKGDEIFIIFENCQYLYRVSEKFFLERGEELPKDLTNSKNMIILISCWPPGKDIRRIAIEAILEEPVKEIK